MIYKNIASLGKSIDNTFCLFKSFISKNAKNLAIIYATYFIALFSLILANFNFRDDVSRSIHGFFEFTAWNRFTTQALAQIFSLNHNFFLNTFPLSLFIAILFLSLSSLILVNIIGGGGSSDCKITPTSLNNNVISTSININKKSILDSKLPLFASIVLGLSPFYLECLSWKFDAPFMALSVIASIFPFLFIDNKRVFFIISIICLLIMLTSYQASSGIYIMLSLYLIFKSLIAKEYKQAYKTLGSTSFSYIVAGVIFYCVFYEPKLDYANNNIVPLSMMFEVVYNNIATYIKMIYSDLSGDSKVFIILCYIFSIIFIIKHTIESKINKILAFILSILTLILLFILSQGLYIILIKPFFAPRAFIGFGVFVAIIALDSIMLNNRFLKVLSYVLITIFAWYLISFASYYGQVLKEHDNFIRLRYTLLASDLTKVLDNNDRRKDKRFNILLDGYTGDSPIIFKSKKQYPIIRRLVPDRTNGPQKSSMLNHYGIDLKITKYTKELKALPKENLVKSYYHNIYKLKHNNDVYYLIKFNPIKVSKRAW